MAKTDHSELLLPQYAEIAVRKRRRHLKFVFWIFFFFSCNICFWFKATLLLVLTPPLFSSFDFLFCLYFNLQMRWWLICLPVLFVCFVFFLVIVNISSHQVCYLLFFFHLLKCFRFKTTFATLTRSIDASTDCLHV